MTSLKWQGMSGRHIDVEAKVLQLEMDLQLAKEEFGEKIKSLEEANKANHDARNVIHDKMLKLRNQSSLMKNTFDTLMKSHALECKLALRELINQAAFNLAMFSPQQQLYVTSKRSPREEGNRVTSQHAPSTILVAIQSRGESDREILLGIFHILHPPADMCDEANYP